MFIFENTTDNTVNSQYGTFFNGAGALVFRTNDGVGGFVDSSVSTVELTVDEWQHVAVTYNGSVQTIYINGEVVAEEQQDITLPTSPAAGPAYIGAFAKGEGYYFNGLIDDLKIFGAALDQGDVQFAMKRTGIDTTTATTQPYVLEYKTTDSTGHTTIVQRKISVSDDASAPVIQLVGSADIDHEAGTAWADPGFTANDNVDGNITPLVAVSSEPVLDITKPGIYVLSYNVSDSSFNKATTITRNVTIQDTILPVITLLGDEEVTIEKGSTYTDAGATALDSLDGNITAKITNGTSLANVDTNTVGEYTVTYNVSDLAGNAAAQVTRKVIVEISDKFVDWAGQQNIPVGKQGLLDDPDNDRVPNLLEYAIGGNPNVEDRKSTLPEVNSSSGSLAITFLRLKPGVDDTLTYKVELTRKLKGGTWAEADVTLTVDADQTGVQANYEKVTATSKTPIASETEGSQFIRVTIERP